MTASRASLGTNGTGAASVGGSGGPEPAEGDTALRPMTDAETATTIACMNPAVSEPQVALVIALLRHNGWLSPADLAEHDRKTRDDERRRLWEKAEASIPDTLEGDKGAREIAAYEAFIAQRVREQVAAEIYAEALDMDPDREAEHGDRLPGAAGNTFWRAMCEANGLWRAVRVARKCPLCACESVRDCARGEAR